MECVFQEIELVAKENIRANKMGKGVGTRHRVGEKWKEPIINKKLDFAFCLAWWYRPMYLALKCTSQKMHFICKNSYKGHAIQLGHRRCKINRVQPSSQFRRIKGKQSHLSQTREIILLCYKKNKKIYLSRRIISLYHISSKL